MSGNFAQISFTPSVLEAQERYGSRTIYSRLDGVPAEPATLGTIETGFIEARDGFYQATVSETGWPYVQFRGGPAGFLKVLDDRTIGYADFRGNRQYLSVGNISGNDRVALILMDYARQRRLKIWARARIVHRDEAPELVASLEMPDYRARVERAVVLTVEAFDWNCPQHIEPRFTEAEIMARTRPLEERICYLEGMLSGRTDGHCEC
jgi:predicted pyridoxine 5'-phosphate oxidase superfamily flavin-nucleotide-binding protein